jgi:hypothetical protein
LNEFFKNIDPEFQWTQEDGTLFRGEDRDLDEILESSMLGNHAVFIPPGREASPPVSYTTDLLWAMLYTDPLDPKAKARIRVIWQDSKTKVKSGVSINNVKDWRAGDSHHSEVMMRGDIEKKVLGRSLQHIVTGVSESGVTIQTVLVVETEEV